MLCVTIAVFTWNILLVLIGLAFFVTGIVFAIVSLSKLSKYQTKKGIWAPIGALVLFGLLILLYSGGFNFLF